MAMQVLVVDDEMDVCSLFQQRFRKEVKSQKLHFAFANSGKEALQYLRNHNSERITVLSDINMPGMSGLELLEHIGREFESQKPEVYMITAYGDLENYQRAIGLGAIDLPTFSNTHAIVTYADFYSETNFIVRTATVGS